MENIYMGYAYFTYKSLDMTEKIKKQKKNLNKGKDNIFKSC